MTVRLRPPLNCCRIDCRGVSCIPLSIVCVVALGAASDALAQQWLIDANNRIEQYRKADLTVEVVDSLGQAVPGADVHVEMKRHSFGFGTAVTAGWINDGSANGNTYRQKLLENFNQVVFENDLKWPPWIGLWGGGFNWTNTENAMDWLDANNLPIRGHYLSWATWSGNDAYGTSQNINTLQSRLFSHITDKAGTVGNRVFEWDVINHPVGWLGDTYENRMENAGLYAEGLDFYANIVDHSRSVAPAGMDMWINEDDVIAGNSRANDYERIIDYLIDNGSSPDGIGFQGHFIQEWGRVTGTPIDQLYGRIDRFADIIPRVRVTEFDIDVGTDEAWQGQLMHDYLTVMFSHPDMEAVTMWGFWGGSHWRGENGALYRTDWTEKPSLASYQDLVFDQWWTDEMGASDGLGEYDVRGFKGLYDITVTYNGQDYVVPGVLLDGNMNVMVTVPGVLFGDYNDDGIVNGADYTVWRDNMDNPSFDLPNEDATEGEVTEHDFTVWRAHFGEALPGSGAGAASAAIPEPASAVLTVIALAALAGRNFRRR